VISLNGFKVTPTLFPDGTSQIWHEEQIQINNRIDWIFEREEELFHIAQLKNLIDVVNHGKKNKYCSLQMDYLPYARQDKPITNTTTFALRTFAAILNMLGFDVINVQDPHSDLARQLIHNLQEFYPVTQVINCFECVRADIVCYPDEGAVVKYNVRYPFNYIHGVKIRNQRTGRIISYKILKCTHIRDRNVLIVDDICDGGATFTLLSKALYKKGAKEVHLFVSHGLFTKGIEVLKDAGILRIFTRLGEIT
jgi:ribose-phosphate pyrophosphokinase